MGRRQQEKSELTRSELMLAALHLFAKYGFEATSVDQVTSMAGYAKGSFYRHWESKEALFLDLMDQRVAEHTLMLDAALSQTASVKEMLAASLALMDRVTQDDNWAPMFVEFCAHASRTAAVRERISRMYLSWSRILAERLLRFAPAAQRSFCPEPLAALIIALFDGFQLQQIAGVRLIDRQNLERAIAVLVHDYLKGQPDGNHLP